MALTSINQFSARLDTLLHLQSHFSRPKNGSDPGKTLFTLSSKAVYGDRMTDIMPHKHCMVCGNAVRPDENFCDEICESKFKSAQRKQQLLFLAFLAIMGLVLFLPSILRMFG
jgi:predicted nucleic acid-binding Zn ribbon protein